LTIKPLQQHSLLLTGVSRYQSSQLLSSSAAMLTTAEADPILNGAHSTILQHGRAVNTKTVIQRGSEPTSSDDESSLSDSDPDLSSDDDNCSSEDEQTYSSSRKNTKWEGIDVQRLLAYKKENKSWAWIWYKAIFSSLSLSYQYLLP
jgi:hypothetical protein